jgi:RNA recognition motif-containing protein
MNLYVSNLGEKTTDESLKAAFVTHGQVSSAKIIKDHFTGYSRGFAFVEMPNEAEANNAISKLNGSSIDGQIISVKEAKPKVEHKGSYPARKR